MSVFITNAELRIEAERLCDENEQLRSEKAALERRIDELCAEVERLNGETAKLRKLCHETWRSCSVEEYECKKCPHYLGDDGDVWCDIPIQMAELGIEVD